MHGPLNVKFANAKQVKEIYQYRNSKEKLYKTNAAIWCNKISGEKQLASYYKNRPLSVSMLYFLKSNLIYPPA